MLELSYRLALFGQIQVKSSGSSVKMQYAVLYMAVQVLFWNVRALLTLPRTNDCMVFVSRYFDLRKLYSIVRNRCHEFNLMRTVRKATSNLAAASHLHLYCSHGQQVYTSEGRLAD